MVAKSELTRLPVIGSSSDLCDDYMPVILSKSHLVLGLGTPLGYLWLTPDLYAPIYTHMFMLLSGSHYWVVDTLLLYHVGLPHLLYHALHLFLFMTGWEGGGIPRLYDYSVSPKSLLLFLFFMGTVGLRVNGTGAWT